METASRIALLTGGILFVEPDFRLHDVGTAIVGIGIAMHMRVYPTTLTFMTRT